jgi:hypothetical protein
MTLGFQGDIFLELAKLDHVLVIRFPEVLVLLCDLELSVIFIWDGTDEEEELC